MADQVAGLLSPILRWRRFSAARPYVKGRVLDIGCGVGHLSRDFPSNSYIGIDSDPESIEVARSNNPGKSFALLSQFDEAVKGQFDTIVCLAVIEHVDQPIEFLEKLRPFLARNGQIVLTTPNPRFDHLHGIGAKLGLFTQEAHDEHQSLMDRMGILRNAQAAELSIDVYKRFLLGANQLAVLSRRQ
jgi:2-polyprenyl-3-methyl-5-hydroxy-6-metoxy-1,4-benzoquinol methylase